MSEEQVKSRECRVIFTPVVEQTLQQYRVALRDVLGHLKDRAHQLGLRVEVTTPKDVRRV